MQVPELHPHNLVPAVQIPPDVIEIPVVIDPVVEAGFGADVVNVGVDVDVVPEDDVLVLFGVVLSTGKLFWISERVTILYPAFFTN